MKSFSFLVELIDLLRVEDSILICCKNEVELNRLVNNYNKAKWQIGNISNLGIVEGIKETDIKPFLKKEDNLEVGKKKEESNA